MNIDVFTQYFTDGTWLANFLTSFIAIFVPLISLLANLIGKYKNSVKETLKKFKEQYGDKMDADLEELKKCYAQTEANLKELQKQLANLETQSDKTLAVTTIAYQNSNLSPSVKNEISKIVIANEITETTITDANNSIIESNEMDKEELPPTLEEIANEVENGSVEQNKIVL